MTRAGESEDLPLILPFFEEANGIISQEELWFEYYSRNREIFKGSGTVPGVMARVYRAYPSLVRERHLLHLLRSEGTFDWVLNDPRLDAAGVDFLVILDGRAFGVHAYLATERGRSYRELKRKRHKDIGIVIDMPLDPEHAYSIGKFSAYGDSHIQDLKGQIYAYQA